MAIRFGHVINITRNGQIILRITLGRGILICIVTRRYPQRSISLPPLISLDPLSILLRAPRIFHLVWVSNGAQPPSIKGP